MCGRYTYKFTWAEIHHLLGLTTPATALEIPPSYNVAPTQSAPIVRQRDGGRVLEFAKWGLTPPWASGPGPINARAETAATNAMFRSAFKNGRCVVPASGFYEWQKLGEGPKPAKQPWYIHRADGAPLFFAGLRERGKDGDTFAIITTDANGFMRPIHDRMPAVLEPESVAAWLAEPDPALLAPAADGVLTAHRIGTRVNSPKNNDATLIERDDGGPARVADSGGLFS